MRRDSDCPHLVRWQPDDPYVVEDSDVGRKIGWNLTIQAQDVGRYVWQRDGNAWIETDQAYERRMKSLAESEARRKAFDEFFQQGANPK